MARALPGTLQLMRDQTVARARWLRIFFGPKFCERNRELICNETDLGAVESGTDGHVLEYLLRLSRGHHLVSCAMVEGAQIKEGAHQRAGIGGSLTTDTTEHNGSGHNPATPLRIVVTVVR
jgi:hypothetical protein